ncbi:MAG: FtsX-like permease family protein [Bacteroidota bacterium]
MSKTPQPPKRALNFLRWFCREDYLEEVEGNLVEIFEQEASQNLRKARWQFSKGVLLHLRPDFLKVFQHRPIVSATMFKHNLLITYRNAIRNTFSFLINLLGLTAGLSTVLLIALWVQDEWKVDKFHEVDEQLYHVMQNFEFSGDVQTWDYTPVLLAEAMKKDFPEVKEAVSISNAYHNPQGLALAEDKSIEVKGAFVSQNFFDVLTYPLLYGNSSTALSTPEGILISENLAIRLFKASSLAVGKEIVWKTRYFDQAFRVEGVFQNPPSSATRQFDAAVSMEKLLNYDANGGIWTGDYAETYVVLHPSASKATINQKLDKYLLEKHPSRTQSSLFLQKYSDRYLYGIYEEGKLVGGRISYLRLFGLIALVVLLIACINFMNLATARASSRGKEIGVKKAFGVKKATLIFQFLTESTFITFLACLLALVLVYILLPFFNEITGKFLTLDLSGQNISYLTGFILLTGLVAGSYPALYLSGFSPIHILKGKITPTGWEYSVRKGLVVFQFALSVIFLVGVLIINQQLAYTQSKNLGFSREQVISFQRPPHQEDPEIFLNELSAIAGVQESSSMVWSIMDGTDSGAGYSWTGSEEEKEFSFQSPKIGYDVIETLEMEIVSGRSFSREFGDEIDNIIINETAQQYMGLSDPVGKVIKRGNSEKKIIGVVKDFHYGSIHQLIQPLILRFRRHGRDIMIKVDTQDLEGTLAQVEGVFKAHHPEYSFDYHFLSEEYEELYQAESRVSVLSTYFSGLAILISCLGLLGLATFMAENRAKEIGIRKILGASVWKIVSLLSTDFTKMVLVGIGIAIPVSYLLSKQWLSSFAYRIELDWMYFGIAAILTLLIAWLAVSIQTLKAANINPVELLRDE